MTLDETLDLLERWRRGDREALDALLERDLDWIRACVHRRLGRDLRQMGDTEDFVHEALVLVLRHGPRFVLSSRDQLRALLAKIVLNVVRGKHRELHALKRDPRRERHLASASALWLDHPVASVTPPDEAAAREEEREWLRLGLLLLEPGDQEVIDLHWQGLMDREIGERLGTSENTARMRRSRATSRLTKVVLQLKDGRVAQVIEERPDE